MDILSGNQPSSSATSNRYSFSHQRRVSSGFSNTTTNDSSFTFFRSDNSGSDTASINTSHSNINPSPNPNQNNNSSSLVSDSHHQMFSVDPSVSASASANNSYSHHNDLLKSQNSRAMANEDLDINTVLSGLDLDYSSPRRLSSNNSNSSLLNTSATTATANPINDRVSISGNPLNNNNANNNNNINNINNNNSSNNNSSAAAAGMYQLNGINEIKPKHHQNRVSFSLLDFNNDANDMSVIGGTNGNANGAHTPNYHQHSWSVASFPSVANGNFGAQTQTVPTAAIAPVGASAAHSPLDYEPMGNGFNMGTYGNNGSSQELGLDPTAAAAQAAAQAAQANVAAQAAAAQAAAAAAANGGIDRNLHSPITAATPSAAYYDYPSSKSRFAHSASRSVSNPLFTNLENGNSRENLGSNRPTTASSNSSQYSNSGYPKVNNANVPTYFEENRGYPLNELNPNLLSNNPKSHVPSNNVISNNNNNNGTGNGNNGNSAAVPLWQKHLKNRLVDGNYGHRRSWSIASYSSVSNPPQQTNDPNGYIIASNNTNNNNNGSRENNNSSNDEFAAVNEMQNGSVIGIASPPVGGPPPVRTPQPSANYNQKSSRSGSNAAPINANYISSGSPMMFAQHQIHPHSHHPHPMNAYSHGVAAPPPPPHPYMNQYRSPVNHPAAVEQFRAASPNINGLPLNAYNGGQYGQNNGLAPLISASTGNGSPHPHHHGGNVAPGGPMSNLHVNNRRGFSGNFGNGNGNNSNNGNGNSNNGPQGGRRRGDDVSRFLNATIDDFKGQIYSLCKDQHGCRFLQRQLDIYDVQKNHKENVKLASDNSNGNGNGNNHKNKSENYAATLIFNEINNNIVELMTDQFGNYLIQKLLDQVTVKQRIQLIKNSCDHFIKISLDSHGTRALQKLIEVISTQEENLIIIRSFENDIVSLSRDLNGNHVVQKILTKFNYKSENIQFIFNAACKNCIKISTHRHGCCVLQRCLDYGSVDQCKQLSMVIAKNCLNLAVDPFGNYVVQYVLSKGEEESIKIIVDSILSKILFLSTHKFGSNVIEKILRINNLSHTVIDEILKNSSNNIIAGGANGANSTTVIGAPPPNVFLSKLLHDPYGNYVLQTVLDVAERPNQFNQLAELIKPILPSVRNTAHGRRIAAKVQAGQQLTSSAASVASQAQPQQMPLQDFVHQQQQQQQQQQIQMPLGQQQQQQQQQQQ